MGIFKKESNVSLLPDEVIKSIAEQVAEMLKKDTISPTNDEPQVEISTKSKEENVNPIATENKKPVKIPIIDIPVIKETKENNTFPVEPLTDKKIVEEIGKFKDEIGKLSASFEVFYYKEKINKELHEELQKYRSGLRKEFITPLLKHIIRESNRADKQYRFYLQKSKQSQGSELFEKLLTEFQMLSFALLDLLNDYGIEIYEVKIGEPFSGKIHKIVEIIDTEDAQQNDTVAECVTCGFHDVESDRILQVAEVKIYKKK